MLDVICSPVVLLMNERPMAIEGMDSRAIDAARAPPRPGPKDRARVATSTDEPMIAGSTSQTAPTGLRTANRAATASAAGQHRPDGLPAAR